MPTQYGLRFSRFDGILMHTEKIICYISDMKKPPEFNLKIYIKTLQIKKIISYIIKWELIHWRLILPLIDAQFVPQRLMWEFNLH